MDFSVVVPVYKSGSWISELAERIYAAVSPFGSVEVLLVNDHSPDAVTWPAVEECAKRLPYVRGIDLVYNVGQFKATLCGIEKSSGEYVLTIDDDFQHPPEELPKLIEAMKAGTGLDCVFGAYAAKRHSAFRNLGSKLVQRITAALYGKRRDVVTTSFRIMTRDFANVLTAYRSAAPQLGPLIVRLSKRLANVTVEHRPRTRGESGYSLAKCVSETFQSIVNASTRPIRMFTAVGFVSSIAAFAITLYYLLRWMFLGTSVAGYTSQILVTSFFSGLILMGIGILGEYIGRIISELTGTPRFMIRKEVGGGVEP